MNLLASLGQFVFFVVSLVVAFRLLHLSWWARQWQALVVGLAVLLLGPMGYSLIGLSLHVRVDDPTAGALLLGAATLTAVTGASAVAVFTWRVFRSAERWAAGLALALVGTMLVAWVGTASDTGFGMDTGGDPWTQLSMTVRIATMFWGAAESLLYYGRMRRRVAVGLAEPVLANRFLLWGVAMISVGTSVLIILIRVLIIGTAGSGSGTISLIVLPGMTAAISLYLAFLPPASYRRHLVARAQQSART